jgi:hypothetical protein
MSMNKIPAHMILPHDLAEIDAAFMSELLRARGVIGPTNAVVSIKEEGVGMTAGYFSAIKRMRCEYAEPTSAPKAYVAKTWPAFEIAPRASIQAMFKRDVGGYLVEPSTFFPRPRVYLADFDLEKNAWALVMEDAELFAEHKVHERELDFDEVMRMVPRLAATAAAWEGCHEGPASAQLDALGVQHWACDENLAVYRGIMPGGAKLIDKMTSMAMSSLIEGGPWGQYRHVGSGLATLLTNKIDAFYGRARPERGATCTLCHGDLRGDNIFFCEPSDRYPDGWLTIDFQLMFRGPVPSDLAYLMSSASVLPSVFDKKRRQEVLRAFYESFRSKTKLYKDYSWEQCEAEFTMMSTVLFIYYVGFGAAIWQAGAVANQHPARVELGGQGTTEAELAPDELRKRMWWRKSFTNFRNCFEACELKEQLEALPSNTGPMGSWFELPPHLRT